MIVCIEVEDFDQGQNLITKIKDLFPSEAIFEDVDNDLEHIYAFGITGAIT